MSKSSKVAIASLSRAKKPSVKDRRRFLGRLGGAAAASAALSFIGSSTTSLLDRITSTVARAAEIGPLFGAARADLAAQIRNDATAFQRTRPLSAHPCNGDEARYPQTRIGSYTKALPHDSLGFVDPNAYNVLLQAIASGDPADFEAIPIAGDVKLVDPQAGLAFTLEGADSHALTMPAAPRWDSAEEAGEMVELYWQALTRDVSYADYGTGANTDSAGLTTAAVNELNTLSVFRGPRQNGLVTPGTLFRGVFQGDLIGPYISQFLFLDVPYGAQLFQQRIRTVVPNLDYLTNFTDFLNVQNGSAFGQNIFDPTRRYIRNERDAGEYVHRDFPQQTWINAALILLAIGTPPTVPFLFGAHVPGVITPFDAGNPYGNSRTQFGFPTFGQSDAIDLATDVPNDALREAWYQKWNVHRRLRPEEFGGQIDNQLNGRATYPFTNNREVLTSRAVAETFNRFQSYLLPQAFPEGSPTHTSYPSGHATYAGAAVTVLKAYFSESAPIPSPRVPSADGTRLVPLSGVTLTIGNELNKLASNIALARNAAGVHWRTDAVEGLRLGERLGIRYLQDLQRTYNQNVRNTFPGFSLTRFSGGAPILITETSPATV